MSIEKDHHTVERPRLLVHPTNTDHTKADKILFIHEQSHQIRGPLIKDHDNVSISYGTPEPFDFENEDGTTIRYLVKKIEGQVLFTHAYYPNGSVAYSAPMDVDFVDGSIVVVDTETTNERLLQFRNCLIDLRAYEGDVIEVAPKVS